MIWHSITYNGRYAIKPNQTKSCIYIYIYVIWHSITYKGWYAIKPNQPTNQPSRASLFDLASSTYHKRRSYLGTQLLLCLSVPSLICFPPLPYRWVLYPQSGFPTFPSLWFLGSLTRTGQCLFTCPGSPQCQHVPNAQPEMANLAVGPTGFTCWFRLERYLDFPFPVGTTLLIVNQPPTPPTS